MTTDTLPTSVLCVCLGNICRSPTAEAIFTQKLADAKLSLTLDSAGTSATHAGEMPDARSRQHAQARGYALDHIRSRQVTDADFTRFDLILAMDHANLNALTSMKAQLRASQQDAHAKLARIALLSEKSADFHNQPVPDPYYGGSRGFEAVLDMCECCIDAWIDTWINSLDQALT